MVKNAFPLHVECYSGYRSEETPRVLRLGARTVRVHRILDRWLAPDHRYFKILGDDGDLYIIRHDVRSWQWEMTFYRAGETGPNTLPLP